MRIIAGEKRSRRLIAPEGMETRPTADRAKEALFSILMNRLPGARVLDLYRSLIHISEPTRRNPSSYAGLGVKEKRKKGMA